MVFLFHLLVPVVVALVTFFGLALLSLLFFSCVCLVSFGCGHGCRALPWILCGRFSFLPFRLDLSGLRGGVTFQSSVLVPLV